MEESQKSTFRVSWCFDLLESCRGPRKHTLIRYLAGAFANAVLAFRSKCFFDAVGGAGVANPSFPSTWRGNAWRDFRAGASPLPEELMSPSVNSISDSVLGSKSDLRLTRTLVCSMPGCMSRCEAGRCLMPPSGGSPSWSVLRRKAELCCAGVSSENLRSRRRREGAGLPSGDLMSDSVLGTGAGLC